MNTSLIIAAGGTGTRFGGGIPKQYLKIDGVTVLEKALNAFCGFKGDITEIVVALDLEADAELVMSASPAVQEGKGEESCLGKKESGSMIPAALKGSDYNGIPIKLVQGGAQRQDSIRNALLAASGDYVLIHDAARPWVNEAVISGVLDALKSGRLAAVPCVTPKNTIRTASATLNRSELYEVQTPQGFKADALKKAYEFAYEKGFVGTDDISVLEYYLSDEEALAINKQGDSGLNSAVAITKGDYANIKITTREDMPGEVRFGNGYDVHRLVYGRPLMLGCINIPYEKGLLGHSDADVLSHAIADALLGAAALPDIGRIFPDDSAKTEGMAGSEILRITAEKLREKGYNIMMVDSTVIAEKPKLMGYIDDMRGAIAKALSVPVSAVNVKATTEEKMSDVSTNGMAAIATCVLVTD